MRRMFSENQIKSIAQQFGGTKLYEHIITFTNVSQTISIISTYNKKATNGDELDLVVLQAISFMCRTSSSGSWGFLDYEDSSIKIMTINNDDSLYKQVNIDYTSEEFTDQILPL